MQPLERDGEHAAGKWTAYGLLTLAFVTGGSSQRWGLDDFIVQGLSVPVAAWAGWTLLRSPPPPLAAAAAATALLLSLLPMLQLSPLPADAWAAVDVRAALQRDLATVGAEIEPHWTLAPTATWRAWAATLPGLACFLAVLAFARTPGSQRTMLRLIVALAVGSMLLGIVQMAFPQDSLLNPFPEWYPLFRGVFAHFNHQGTSAAIGMLIALALCMRAMADRGRASHSRANRWEIGSMAFAAIFLLLGLPLTTSRAAVTLAVVGLALVPLAMGLVSHGRMGRWPARLALVATVAILAVGLLGTAGWMQVDSAHGLRAPMRAATAILAETHAPWGVGAGGFVPAFEQAAPDALLLSSYVNHAHHQYLHWWAELAWLALLGGMAGAGLLMTAMVEAWRGTPTGRGEIAVGASAAVGLLMAHSVVEYPLHTPALLAVGAALAAVLFRIPSTKVVNTARSARASGV